MARPMLSNQWSCSSLSAGLEAVADMSAHVKTELGADEDYVEAELKVWQSLCAIYIYIYACMSGFGNSGFL